MSDFIEPDFVANSASEPTSNPFADPVAETPHAFGRGTLDEPVTQTLKRDLIQINARLKQVVYPSFTCSGSSDSDTTTPSSSLQGDHCADLWAPLLFTIAFSVALSRASSQFPRIFVLSWASLVVLAAHLTLGSSSDPEDSEKIPFLAAVSTCGYCFFPQVINAVGSSVLLPLIVSFIRNAHLKSRILTIARLAIFAGCAFWSCRSSVNATRARHFINRYPLVLVLVSLNWSCVVA
ncbi:Yip4p LALA0_S01e13300g [Lachancea lanzarotensis]|uniref:LALA0S01e13300g1_1 n=1 Tax=Lachancea lanzarotensis TaxID=1245769 RepID=A0A0C7MYI3_9SACH|nr:uncharacterized protein LALA0_S01e13300g [Lachancea lanzarotensis]CEP60542.1 LALA0S01e13300g1_1 [Lachancea lanzarotensis]